LTAGCNSSKPLPLQSQFAGIMVSQTDAAEVLNLLDEEGMLATESAVSVFNRYGASREAGLIQFNPEDTLVCRKDYIQVRSYMTLLLFTQEKLNFLMQTIIPDEVLHEPYESNTQEHRAILQYCRDTLVEDARPFLEDQETFGLVGMARSALQQASVQLADQPRQAPQLTTDKGFVFTHPVFGKSRLHLKQDRLNIYTLTLTSADWVDTFSTW